MHRYSLERYKGIATRFKCPGCGREKQFTRYIDNETGKYIDEDVGMCNRKANCSYHFPPREFFSQNPHLREESTRTNRVRVKNPVPIPARRPFDAIDRDVLDRSLDRYEKNNFIRFLMDQFGHEAAIDAAERYQIGTWADGRTVFWQIDTKNRIRTGKIMHYDPRSGKRVKSVPPSWVHYELLKMARGQAGAVRQGPLFRLEQCFFGEHLLPLPTTKRIGMVESEKSAVIASMFVPELAWLATGGCSNLNLDSLLRTAIRRTITLFPDSTQFERWSKIARASSSGGRIIVSDFLEKNLTAGQKSKDMDIADLIINAYVKAS